MISRHEYHGGIWVDIENPSDEEIRSIAQEFHIGTHIEREILAPTPFPLVVPDTDATLLVLHFPSSRGGNDGDTGSQEVDFVVGKHFILTVRYEVVAPLHHLKKLLETQKILEGGHSVTTDMMVEILFAHLYTSVRDHVNHIASRLEQVEKQMFDGHEKSTIRSISGMNREYLHVEAALASHEEPLGHFLDMLVDRGTVTESFAERAQHITGEHAQVTRFTKTHRQVATELRETNSALLEARQNEIIKTLTVITVIILPLELIAAIYKIDAAGTPLAGHPQLFWILIGIMASIAVLMLAFFARKRWLF